MKNKFYSAINILGLTIGMASAILILLWIQNEMSHDRFYEKTDRIYLANNRDKVNGKMMAWNNTPKPLGLAIKKDYPEVEDVVRLNEYAANFLLSAGDKHFSLHGEFADSGFLKMFSLPLLEGNPNTALNNPNSIILTQQLAIKLFGKEDAMGKTVRIDSTDYFTVTAILKDLPANTRFNFEYVLPWSYLTKKGMDDQNWGNNNVLTYILLKAGASQAAFDKKIRDITINHTKDGERSTTQVFTQRLKDTWLYEREENGYYVGGRIERVKMFAVIAALILVIACINFMNLSTARSEKRGKEVGIRKVVGAQKRSLVAQFIGESIGLATIAGIIAVFIVQLVLPAYNQLLASKLFIDFYNPYYWLFAITFILFTGLLAGIYPALYLSSFRPVKVLKGSFKSAGKAVTPRKVLVILQFTFAIVLIICTIIVENQINYAQKRDSGYSRDNLAFIIEFGDARRNYALIKQGLLQSGAATTVAQTSAPMTESWGDSWGFTWQGSNEDDKKTDFNIYSADGDFAKTMGIKIIQGRGIDINTYKTDSAACLLNETAVKVMRLKNPLGTMIHSGNDSVHVVGVVKDFILTTPYEPVQQMIICGPIFGYNVINFKLNPNPSIASSLQKAEAVFKQYNPQYPFNVRYYDREYDLKFKDEKQTGTLAGLFAGLTIFISCLGLLGLATYMAETRIKEIGVRKVLGASVRGIVALLSKDFLKLVLISFLIASPVAWWIMSEWLQSYSYRVNISMWVFIMAGCMSAGIAFITVSFQAIKAAVANPVKSLRTE
ncbi:MAG TPA: ABC transporter permease [Parafilimonas sp.]|nr:ABC transporter permease [Parafilimonas sp.]